MYLFICENYKDKGTTDELVNIALEAFIAETGFETGGRSREILRTEKGKPYFAELPVAFSVSHTGNLWVCLMTAGNDPVGVDIQTARDYSFEKIASRYYTEAEQQLVSENGADAFFRIWTRKEAYAKYTGMGLGSYLGSVSCIENKEVEFTELKIKDGINGACCIKEKKELWIRRI